MAKRSPKYELTPEHRRQLEPWRDRWIANALSTAPLTAEDPARIREAVRGLYAAASRACPPDQRIVIVPSPTVLRFAGGFAAAIWYRRRNPPATWAATEAATRDATWAATRDATEDATRDATGADEPGDTWYRIPCRALATLARVIFSDDALFALQCAVNAYNFWDGGNQRSGWAAFLSFFRHVVKLGLDYSKWQHYETLATYGPRVMHADFCLVSERPVLLTVDAQSRPHNDSGPFCEWRDGTALYAIHGTRVPWWLVEHPERLTLAHIQQEENAEVRRVMFERYGFDRYVRDTGALPIAADDCGTLYQINQGAGVEPLTLISVRNSTPEPDGSVKQYVLRVDPELRPLPPGHWPADLKRDWLERQKAQTLTARNAVASLHGLRGESYRPAMET